MFTLKPQKLIYILTQMKVKNNKMLFNSRDWVTIAPLISNRIYAVYLSENVR